MENPVPELIQHIRRFVKLDDDQAHMIGSHFKRRKLKNKEYLLTEGNVCKENYFIIKGVLRKFINTEKGDKQIIQFSIENWWMTDFTSLESGNPSILNIQSVENGEVGIITKDDLDILYKRVPVFESYTRKVLQRAYEASVMRTHLIFSYSGEERYQRFISSYPEFVQRIPQYMLASYMGLTPEFLSKLRAKKSRFS
jgi:CRP-like cAMP-binding protein